MQKDIQRTQIISADISCIVTACFQNKASCAYRCCCLPSVHRAVFSALSSLELIQERPLLSQADLFFNSAGFVDLAVYINIAPAPPPPSCCPPHIHICWEDCWYICQVCLYHTDSPSAGCNSAEPFHLQQNQAKPVVGLWLQPSGYPTGCWGPATLHGHCPHPLNFRYRISPPPPAPPGLPAYNAYTLQSCSQHLQCSILES